jgi:hypothetical protein
MRHAKLECGNYFPRTRGALAAKQANKFAWKADIPLGYLKILKFQYR